MLIFYCFSLPNFFVLSFCASLHLYKILQCVDYYLFYYQYAVVVVAVSVDLSKAT